MFLLFIMMANSVASASYSNKVYLTKNDLNEKVDSLCRIHKKYLYTNPKKAFDILGKSLALADSIKYKFGSISSKHHLSNYYSVIGDFEVSLKYSFGALNELKILLAEKDFDERPEIYDARLAEIYGAIANVYSNLEYYPLAIKYYNKAEQIFIKQGDSPKALALIYANKSSIYRRNGEIEFAKNMLLKSLKVFKYFKEKRIVGLCYLNMANIHNGAQDYEAMLQYMDSAIIVHTELKDYATLANVYNNKANYYYENKKSQHALTNLDKASELLKKIENKKYLSNNALIRGGIYLQQGQLALAEEILLSELENSMDLMYNRNAEQVCEKLIALYEEKKEPQNILKYKSLLLDFKNTKEQHQDKKVVLEEKYAKEFDEQADLFDFRETLYKKSNTIVLVIFSFLIIQFITLLILFNRKKSLV